MKLFGVLMSFALIGHVMLAQLDEYVKEVLRTNDHIELAKNSMPTIIKKIVQKADVYGNVSMAFMLAVPEKMYSALLEPDFDDPDAVGNDNLDAVDYNSPDSVDGENSEYVEILNEYPFSFGMEEMEDIEEKLEFQKLMQSEIKAETDIDAPDVKLENLFNLLEERRIHTSVALKKRFARACLTSLGITRREITLEAITSLIRQNDPIFSDFHMMCRLLGVFISIKYPSLYIEHTAVNGEYCDLTNENFVVTHVYTIINGEVWEVDLDPDSRAQIKPFLSELQ